MSKGLNLPLYDLLQKNCPWIWTTACEEAFQESKKLLLESQWLVHYDPLKPLKLATDASAYVWGEGRDLPHPRRWQ